MRYSPFTTSPHRAALGSNIHPDLLHVFPSPRCGCGRQQDVLRANRCGVVNIDYLGQNWELPLISVRILNTAASKIIDREGRDPTARQLLATNNRYWDRLPAEPGNIAWRWA
jgi:hypothetical protein